LVDYTKIKSSMQRSLRHRNCDVILQVQGESKKYVAKFFLS